MRAMGLMPNSLALASLICVFMSTLTLIFLALFRHRVATLLSAPEMTTWLLWVPLSVLLAGLYQAFNYWCNRKSRFEGLAVSRASQALGTAGVQVGTGAASGIGPVGLIGGQLAGQLVSTVILIKIFLNKDYKLFSSIFFKKIWQQGITYYRFPLMENWAGLANICAHLLPIVILKYFFDSFVVGSYYVGYRIINLPFNLVATSFGQVFFNSYMEKKRVSKSEEFLKRTIKILIYLSVGPAFLLFLFSPSLFKIVLGKQWVVAGEYVRILVPFMFARFVASPIGNVLQAEGKNSWSLLCQILFLILTIFSFTVGGYFNNVTLALTLFSGTAFFLTIISIFLCVKAAKIGQLAACYGE